MLDLTTMTKQEVFDAIVNHLRTQGEPSIGPYDSWDDAPGCMYRNFDGLKCAAGIFISDDQYKPTMEGKTWDYLVEHGYVPPANQEVVQLLQGVHDQWALRQSGFDLEDEIQGIALFGGFEYTPAAGGN